MSKTRWMVLLMVAAVAMAGCSKSTEETAKNQEETKEVEAGRSDSREQVVEDQLDLMKEEVGVLEGVTDKESAVKAKAKLEELHKEAEAIKARMEKLGDPTEEEKKALQEEYGQQFKEIVRKLRKENNRISTNPETASALKSKDEVCLTNQKMIATAGSLYRLKENSSPTTIDDLTKPSPNGNGMAYLPSVPVCPEGGTYNVETGACTVNHTD